MAGVTQPDPSSFRDPSGFVFRENGLLLRQVNASYAKDYDLLMASGLYAELVKAGQLVSHQETGGEGANGRYKLIKPEELPFISYPYEWSFGQLQDAALLTLAIQAKALEKGMILKDASAYNVQFKGSKPILIDTLSFEAYQEGRPWVAYRQFCQHFLAPLALMAHVDLRLGTLSRQHVDGVPLDLASSLLPSRTRLSVGLLSHLHLHAGSQRRHAADGKGAEGYRLPKTSLLALLDNLRATVKGIKLPRQATEWGDYYDNTNYTGAAQADKNATIAAWLKAARPASVCDIGANQGEYSRLASGSAFTISCDIDPIAVEKNYRRMRDENEANLLPLLIDLTNPSPAIGWANQERPSFLERAKPDLVLCLALIHHLAISNNLPLGSIADFLAAMAPQVIIEFVPKEDSNTKKLLASRPDIFPEYTEAGFEAAFIKRFRIKDKKKVKESERTLYLLERR